MRRLLTSSLAALGVCAMSGAVPSLSAHHSFAAQYDINKPVTLTGAVTKLEWMNPHIYFYLDVKDQGGKVANWAIEGSAPNQLYRNGWRKDSLKVGDIVTVEGRLARDGSRLANMRNATLADGRRLFERRVEGEAGDR